MGISWRQDGDGGASGRDADPRASRGAWYRREGAMSGAIHVRLAHLRGLRAPHASLRLPALGGGSDSARACSNQVGSTEGSFTLRNAAGRSAAHSDVARLALQFISDEDGTTAIE